jgi:hypothetical protein
MKCDFSLRHYEECLREAQKKGYAFLPLREYKRDKDFEKKVYLRHDVDISIELAKQMFDVEQKIGVDSTYFLRLHKYNLFSLESYYFIKELKESRSEIGFHYTEEFARLMDEDPKEMFKRELKVFENIIDDKVYGVCKHLPAKTKAVLTTDFFKSLGIEYDAYEDFFIKDCKYISESAHRWREGCMCNWIGKEDKLCILCHPMWWHKNSPIENM